MRDYYQEMRDACAEIVKHVASDISDPESSAWCGKLGEVLEMAKWVATDKNEIDEVAANALRGGVADAILEAALKE